MLTARNRGLVLGLTAGLILGGGCSRQAPDPYSQGIEFLQSGAIADAGGKSRAMTDAGGKFQAAVEKEPCHVKAAYQSAVLAELNHKPNAAEAAYTKAIDLQRQVPGPKDTSAEANRLREIALDGRELAVAYQRRGLLRAQAEKWGEAIADFTQSLRLQPDDAGTLTERGRVFFRQGLWDLATDDLTAALRLEPAHEKALCSRAEVSKAKGDYNRAMRDCRQVIRNNPASKAAYRILGSVYAMPEVARYEEAQVCYRRAAELGEDCAKEIAAVNEALKPTPPPQPPETTGSPPPGPTPQTVRIASEGDKLAGQGRYDEAIRSFSEQIKRNLDLRNAFLGRARALLHLGLADPALRDLDQAISLNSDLADAWIDRAEANLALRHPVAAVIDATSAVRRQPRDAQVYLISGRAHLAAGQFDLAIADLDQTVELDSNLQADVRPLKVDAYRRRAALHLQGGRSSEAIDDLLVANNLNPALLDELTPDLSAAYRKRGLRQAELGHVREALKDLDDAVDLAPGLADNYEARGRAYFQAENWKAAVDDLRTAVRLSRRERPSLESLLREAKANLEPRHRL
jgi:tetratricopeptide (TPR) repeat protein